MLEVEIIVLSMIIRMVLNGEFYLLYLFTADLFPTYITSTAVRVCNSLVDLVGLLLQVYLSYLMLLE